MTRTTYCAIIGDMTKSRDLSGRKRAQKLFVGVVERVNQEFKGSLVSDFRFRIREGDSFEGLLASPAESYRCTRRLLALMSPLAFSVGIGIGPVATELSADVDLVDGEAFHRARAALAQARKVRQEIVFDFASPAAGLLNALAGLVEKEWYRLTDRQREVIRLMGELGNQERVARKLKITQPAVAKVLGAPTVRKMLEGEHAVHEFLGRAL
jgi:hypothetical protein